MFTHLLTCCPNTTPIKVTGEYDFMIAVAICITIASVAFLIILGFLIWKWSDDRAKEKQNLQRRTEEVEDKNRKEKSVLMDKKLDILKDLCKSKNDYSSKEVDKYVSAIDNAIEAIKL